MIPTIPNPRAPQMTDALVFLLVHGLIMAVALLFCASAASEERIYAVIVANNGSVEQGVRALKYADDDGARYWEFFSSMTDRTHLLATLDGETQKVFHEAARASRPPKRAEVLGTLRSVQSRIRSDKAAGHRTTLFVVFAGHGAVDEEGQGYLSLLDGPFTRRDLLREVVEPDVADRTHIIVDACHAYFMVHERGGDKYKDDRSGDSLDDEFKAFFQARRTLSRYPRVGVLLSTAGAAEVHEWSEYRSGVFSHEVRSGLLGAADIDGDKAVTYRELEAYLEAANASVQDPKARIHVFTEPPRQLQDAPLIELSRIKSATLLSVEPGEPGRYHISDSRGVRYLDFHTAGDGLFHVALLWRAPAFFVRTEETEARLERTDDPVVSLAELTFVYRDSPRGPVEESYRANLYAVPFGKGFYAGYHAGRSRVQGATLDEGLPGVPPQSDLLKGVGLSFAYLLSPPQLSDQDLTGLQHAVDLSADFWLTEHFALQVIGAYGTSANNNTTASNRPFRLHRANLGLGVKMAWQPMAKLDAGFDLRTAHQWLIFSGGLDDQLLGDIFSWRGELAGNLGYHLTEDLMIGLRLGASLSLVSVNKAARLAAPEETIDLLPFAGAFIGLRL